MQLVIIHITFRFRFKVEKNALKKMRPTCAWKMNSNTEEENFSREKYSTSLLQSSEFSVVFVCLCVCACVFYIISLVRVACVATVFFTLLSLSFLSLSPFHFVHLHCFLTIRFPPFAPPCLPRVLLISISVN